MAVGMSLGFQLATNRGNRLFDSNESSDPRVDADNSAAIHDREEFVVACHLLASIDNEFATTLRSRSIVDLDAEEAIEKAQPLMLSIASRLESEADLLRAWNIQATGRNEVISRDIERNWNLMKTLLPETSNV